MTEFYWSSLGQFDSLRVARERGAQRELAVNSTSGIINPLNDELEEQLAGGKRDVLVREPTVESGILTHEVTNKSTRRVRFAD